MKYIILILFIAINSFAQHTLTTSQISGQLNTITTAVPFLLISPDARAGAMGDAGCASTPDVYSNYWNAAKNVFAEKEMGVGISYTPWLRALVPDINLADISTYKKIGRNNIVSISEKYFSLGDISFTNTVGVTIGQFCPYESATSICFSRKLNHNFSVGIATKYIYSDLTGGKTVMGNKTIPGTSFAGDISCFWIDTFMVEEKSSVFAWGINISNVGQKIKYVDTARGDFIPANLRFGISYKLNINADNSIELICDANKLLVPTPAPQDTVASWKNKSVARGMLGSFTDAPDGWKEELHEINIASGIEYLHAKMLSVRGGYFYEHPTKGGRKYLTLGVGVRYAAFLLDFSYLIPTMQRHPLQNTLRLSFTCMLNAIKKNLKKRN